MTFRVDDDHLVHDALGIIEQRQGAANSGVIEHVYRPRGSAVEVLECQDDEILMAGPAGTGKSRACLEKLAFAALKYPGMKGLIVRKVAASLGASALKTWREDVISELLENGTVYYYGGSQEEPPQYRFNNGSTVVIGGLDKPSKIMSTEYDMIFFQEATEGTITDWEHLTTRLRNGVLPYQQLIADCNPDIPTHWLKIRCDEGTTHMINCRHEDNPRLFDLNPDGTFTVTAYGATYMRKLDALTGVRLLRLRYGQWVAAEGMIFDAFRSDLHVIDEMPKGWESWPRYWSIDFGFTNPFVCQMWAEDPDSRLYLYREIYYTKRTVDRHATTILNAVAPEDEDGVRKWIEPKPRTIICDHDAESRARFSQLIGIGTSPADKRVKIGLETTQNRFETAGDGKPRIFFLRSALVEEDPDLVDARKPTRTVEEIPGYVWTPGVDGKPLKEEPVKVNDHGCDGMRYECMDRDPGSRPRIRSFRL